ncbi:hypothetical protein DS901_00745 [Loktanella sp. D2R18]|uniref:ABZJ_00895 family protein n=1 Tax=Rhodobacterales TaxID=204455 RepID=UPI000DE9D44F|nr:MULTISPECIES: ABZJ_00895 family protein [Rhodobacterales]MDO6591324.1 ABZJ_00895 family protein [Yoonia sp. 1_MG-2023]RBW46274.1 hypothetical protein DS901_00745 [Loktanella sp. D2R18]
MNYIRYTGIVFALTVGLPIALGLLMQVTGVNLSSSATSIIPAMSAAGNEGQKFAKNRLRMPTRAETAPFVVLATLIAGGFQVLFTAIVITNVSGYEQLLQKSSSAGLVVGMLVFVVIVIAICNLVFLRMGCKNQLKALEKIGKPK